jgi:hypothetical protein
MVEEIVVGQIDEGFPGLPGSFSHLVPAVSLRSTAG